MHGRFFNQTHHTERRARDKALFAGDESTRIGHVKAVDVFGRVNCRDHGVGIDLLGQRQLNQDAVDASVGVELGNLCQKLLLRRFGRHSKFERTDARIRASLDFVAHINLAGGIVADENHGQRRGNALFGKRGNLCFHFGADFSGKSLAVEDLC